MFLPGGGFAATNNIVRALILNEPASRITVPQITMHGRKRADDVPRSRAAKAREGPIRTSGSLPTLFACPVGPPNSTRVYAEMRAPRVSSPRRRRLGLAGGGWNSLIRSLFRTGGDTCLTPPATDKKTDRLAYGESTCMLIWNSIFAVAAPRYEPEIGAANRGLAAAATVTYDVETARPALGS